MNRPATPLRRERCADRFSLRRGRRVRRLALAVCGFSLTWGAAWSAGGQDCYCPPPSWMQYAPARSGPDSYCPPHGLAPYAPYAPYAEAPQPPTREGAPPDREGELPPELAPPDEAPQFPAQTAAPGVADVGGFGATRGALSSAPNMIGDQFGSAAGAISLLALPVTPAIHHTFQLGGINDLHGIAFVEDDFAEFPNGPDGPPFYVLQDGTGPSPPLGDLVTGLIEGSDHSTSQFLTSQSTSAPTSSEAPFAALRTDQTADVSTGGDDSFVIQDAQVYQIVRLVEVSVPSPSSGAGAVLGRQKIAENNSPLPRDRVFFNYSYFHNTPLAPGGLDVHRGTPGFEKTFWDGLASFEGRFPFASTLDTNLVLDPAAPANAVPEDVEFGNVSAIVKALLWETPTWAVSTGLQIVLPTGKDVRVGAVDGAPLIEVNNDAAHLAPFVGGVYSDGRLFTQAYLQIDAATQGNRVWIVDFQDPQQRLRQVGEIEDATFLYADWGIGYWTLRNPNAALITAAAPTLELHLNQSLETTDVVSDGLFQVGTAAENISVLNLVVGGVLQLGGQSTLAIGYAAPLGAGADREFDGEFRLVFNRYFGRSFNLP